MPLAKQLEKVELLMKSCSSDASKSNQTIQQFLDTHSVKFRIDTNTRSLITEAAKSLGVLPKVFEKCPVSTEQINLAATSAMMLLDQHSRAIWAIAGGTGKSRIILLAAIAIVTKLHE